MTTGTSPVILAVDGGNSTVTIGLFVGDSLAASLSLPSGTARSSRTFYAAWKDFLGKEGIALPAGRASRAAGTRVHIGAVLSSVVPSLTAPLARALTRLTRSAPIVLDAATPCGLSFDVPHPEQVGPDRIANAVAAAHRAGGPAAVVDFGTATTITVVGRQAAFLGGAIMPGLDLMAASLRKGTARLPLVILDTPPQALGKDTEGAIRTGIITGTAGAATRIIAEIEKDLNFEVQLFITGGHGMFMSSLIGRQHTVVPALTLEGMRLVWTHNRGGIPKGRRHTKEG